MEDHHLLASDILCQNSQMNRILVFPVLLLTLLVGTLRSLLIIKKDLPPTRMLITPPLCVNGDPLQSGGMLLPKEIWE